MVKIGFLDILFWLFLFIAAAYVIGKLTGIIESPLWIELLPFISIIFAAGIVYGKLVSFMQASDRKTGYLKNHLDKIEEMQISADKKLYSLETNQKLILNLLTKRK